MCSVTGPNWANVNVTQRTKLVCWESSWKVDCLYSHFSQVSVFYWYTSIMWGLCYLEVQIVKNVGVVGGFMSNLQDVADLLPLYFTDSIAGKGRAFLYVLYFWGSPGPPFFNWSCKWCFIQPFKWWHLGVTVYALFFVRPSNIEQMFLRVNVASQLSLTEVESAVHQRVKTNAHWSWQGEHRLLELTRQYRPANCCINKPIN